MLAINTDYRRAFADLELNAFDSIVDFFGGDQLPRQTAVLVKRETFPLPDGKTLSVFYKQYEHRPPSWRFFGRLSKARCEFANYAVFNRLGIRCAEPLACGERRDGLGRLRRAFIITRAVPEALNLADFLKKHCPNRASASGRKLRDALRRQLAAMTQQIHRAGFFHHDLVWRNVLVSWPPGAEPQICWIDCPRGRFDRWSPWRDRRRLKDLASLDKSAATHCTRGERVAFVKEYLGASRLEPGVKQLIRDALAYRQRRWPEDWHED